MTNQANASNQLDETIELNDDQRVLLLDDIVAPIGEPAIDIVGEDVTLVVSRRGAISVPDSDNTAVISRGEDARIVNRGEISGSLNGISSTGDDLRLINTGLISSDSRAVDLSDGDGIRVRNFGRILGTGDQRNGTLYVDGTVDDLDFANSGQSLIDAGEGNLGDAVSVQVGAVGDLSNDNIDIDNEGRLQGRGDGADVFANGARVNANGSSGLRFFNGSGQPQAEISGSVSNSGIITSEVNVGFLGGVVIEDGVAFSGQIINERSGVFSGPRNGLYIGNAEHDLNITNQGRIASGSRAVNIDGTGVNLLNIGQIVGTDDQRNGTVYSDATADEYSIVNGRRGVIDAGRGNQGAGIALQTGDVSDDVVNATFRNAGFVRGRGQAAADLGLAGDGLRIFSGVTDGSSIYQGTIVNGGRILSESTQGATSAVRFSDGLAYQGTLTNQGQGRIVGAQNGLYFGDVAHQATVINRGIIASGSRAINIDGTGVNLINFGRILGTGDQRNGTVYSDATADDYSINNKRSGVIDAGRGNQGAGVSLQTGEAAGDEVTASIRNAGRIQGRGNGDGNLEGDGIRVFTSVDRATLTSDINNSGLIVGSDDGIDIRSGVTLAGNINNSGVISAGDTGIEVRGRLNGIIKNNGVIRGDTAAIDATGAENSITVNNRGVLDGEVILSGLDDTFTSSSSRGAAVTGGLGNDNLRGGTGRDTVRYDDIDVPVNVILDDNGNGIATRESGFALTFEDVEVDSLNPDAIADDADFLAEALAGNLYFNIHTNDFNGGEIRGQLDNVVSDVTQGGVRTIVLSAVLNAAQEPGPTSDSEATGEGIVTLSVDPDGTISYSLDLQTEGLATSDLLPVAGVSSIHLHNAPAGQNGPVILDVVQDAGGDVNGLAQAVGSDTGDGDVFTEILETDQLASIENVVGSDDSDVILAGAGDNRLVGNDGNDILASGLGRDTLVGGLGNDTFVFGPADGSFDVVRDFHDGADLLDVSAFNFGAAALDSVIAGAQQIRQNTLLTFAEQNTVLLQGTQVAEIGLNDFLA